MPAFRVLVNTPAPHGSVGITTNVFPSMTLGCGAVAGNITSDNIGPQHLINIKRLAYAVRRPEEALQIPDTAAPPVQAVPRPGIAAAVERYLSQRGLAAADEPRVVSGTIARPASDVVDRFLAARRPPPAAAETARTCPANPAISRQEPAVQVVDFVCETDVRVAIQESRKIYIGPKTIVTPSARDLGESHGILVMAQRQ
jgi:hypothetical protein